MTATRKADYEMRKAERERRGCMPGIAGETWPDYERRCGRPELHEPHEFGAWVGLILPGECPGRSRKPCPKGQTTDQCFAPFRYCPVEGCGRSDPPAEATPEMIQMVIDASPTISPMAMRMKHAVEQIDYALTDSRIAAW